MGAMVVLWSFLGVLKHLLALLCAAHVYYDIITIINNNSAFCSRGYAPALNAPTHVQHIIDKTVQFMLKITHCKLNSNTNFPITIIH